MNEIEMMNEIGSLRERVRELEGERDRSNQQRDLARDNFRAMRRADHERIVAALEEHQDGGDGAKPSTHEQTLENTVRWHRYWKLRALALEGSLKRTETDRDTAQAECEAMREALQHESWCADCGEGGCATCPSCTLRAALSGEAGKAMGKRIADLEAGCRDLKAALDMEREAEAIQRQRATDLEVRLRAAVEARCGIHCGCALPHVVRKEEGRA